MTRGDTRPADTWAAGSAPWEHAEQAAPNLNLAKAGSLCFFLDSQRCRGTGGGRASRNGVESTVRGKALSR